jgi:GNAT superfamily N-acetyltransferase
VGIRLARASDLERATETIALAFATDPVWGVALEASDGRTDHLAAYWRMFVEGSHAHGGVWLLDGGAAVSIWVPPGAQELDPAATASLEAFNEATFGDDGAGRLRELFDRFDANHPQTEPHAYLSLLATRPELRGRGIGQTLLADVLGRWDALGVPSYLESTNPANDHRYVRAGFRPIGGFLAVIDGAPITTMWRAVGGPG